MPPLAIHTAIARQMADSLRAPELDQQRGNVYLGSTAPDVRVLTRWDRQRTHYFDIHNFGDQSSVGAFFDDNPALSDAAGIGASSRAFLAGYLSHLVVDEMWINAVYRPFFGERSTLGGTIRANVIDRALQFSLDADRRADSELMMHVLNEVAGCDLDLDIGFIDRDTLGQWHNIITEYVQSQPDWDRFRERARKHLQASGDVTETGFVEIAESLPDLVDEALRTLSRDRIDEVLQECTDASVRVVKEYLACA
jgi:hypothetical protein